MNLIFSVSIFCSYCRTAHDILQQIKSGERWRWRAKLQKTGSYGAFLSLSVSQRMYGIKILSSRLRGQFVARLLKRCQCDGVWRTHRQTNTFALWSKYTNPPCAGVHSLRGALVPISKMRAAAAVATKRWNIRIAYIRPVKNQFPCLTLEGFKC